MPDLLFTAEAAAARLRLRASTLRTWARSGKVPHRRLGRALRFSEADLRQIVEAAARPAAAPAGWIPVPLPKHRSPRRRGASRDRAFQATPGAASSETRSRVSRADSDAVNEAGQ